MVNRMNRMTKECLNIPNGGANGGSEIKQLIKKLQTVDFSLVDTVLYLDAYPGCKKALAYYHKLLEERKKLRERLKELGAAVDNMSNTADRWSWTDAPWPWEYEAN